MTKQKGALAIYEHVIRLNVYCRNQLKIYEPSIYLNFKYNTKTHELAVYTSVTKQHHNSYLVNMPKKYDSDQGIMVRNNQAVKVLRQLLEQPDNSTILKYPLDQIVKINDSKKSALLFNLSKQIN